MNHRVHTALLAIAMPTPDDAMPSRGEAHQVLLLIEFECISPDAQGNLMRRLATPMVSVGMKRDHVRCINEFILAHEEDPHSFATASDLIGLINLAHLVDGHTTLPHDLQQALEHWTRIAENEAPKTKTKPRRIHQAYAEVVQGDSETPTIKVLSSSSPVDTTREWRLTQFGNHPRYFKTRELLSSGDPLSLLVLELDYDSEEASAGFIVLEPDYLVPATTLAEQCFRNGGGPVQHEAGLFFLGLTDQRGTTEPMFLGIAGNALFDQQIQRHGLAEFDRDTKRNLFLNSPLEFTNSDIFRDDASIPEFLNKCQLIHENIGNTLQHGVAKWGTKEIPVQDILADDLMLEASYMQPFSGFQGRMDLLSRSSDGRHIAIELKSGKEPDLRWDPSGLKVSHEVQTRIYDLFFRTHKVINTPSETHRLAFLFYSQVRNPHSTLRQTPTLAYDQLLLEGRNAFIFHLRRTARHGKSWGRHQFQNLCSQSVQLPKYVFHRRDQYHDRIARMSDLHWEYFRHFYSALISEHWATQTGDNSLAHHDQWNTDIMAEGLDDRILKMGYLCELDPCTHRFQFNADLDATAMKQGDMVLIQDAALKTLSDGPVQRGRLVDSPSHNGTLDIRFMDPRPASTFEGKRWNLRADRPSGNLQQTTSALWACLTGPEHAALREGVIDGQLSAPVARPVSIDILPLRDGTLSPESHDELKSLLSRALNASPYFVVQGPPGTGKTDLFIKNLAHNHQRLQPGSTLIITAFTNRAVDEICDKLRELQDHAPNIRFSRIGRADSAGGRSKPDVLNEQLSRIQDLNREKVKQHIDDTTIWVSTVHSLARNQDLLSRLSPDMVIVDEAGQLNEYLILGPLFQAKRFVLVGDAKQLPAISQIPEKEAKDISPALKSIGIHDLRASLFERLERRHRGDHARYGSLTHHARMHPDVAWYVNQRFYEGQLRIAGTPHQIQDRGWFDETEQNSWLDLQSILSKARMVFLDEPNYAGVAKQSQGEIDRIIEILHGLQSLGRMDSLDEKRIGIIAPFRLQCAQIRKRLRQENEAWGEYIAVDTVERFQGSQRDIILFSASVGSLKEMRTLTSTQVVLKEGGPIVDRKLNVAISRAKTQFILIGDAAILRTNAVYADLLDHIADRQVYIPHSDQLKPIIGHGGHPPAPEPEYIPEEPQIPEAAEPELVDYLLEPTETEETETATHTDGPIQIPQPITPSRRLAQVWRQQVVNKVRQADGSILGLEMSDARELVGFGRADFRTSSAVSSASFSAEEKVLTYAYTNARMHLLTLVGLLPEALYDLELNGGSMPIQVIDYGCGPGGGLHALNELRPHLPYVLTDLSYLGVDIAEPMLSQGKSLTEHIDVKKSWTTYWPDSVNARPTLFLFSYLFANLTTDEGEALAENVVLHVEKTGAPAVGLIQNSSRDDRNLTTAAFLGRLRQLGQYQLLEEGVRSIEYRSNPRATPRAEDVLFHRFLVS